MESTFRDCNSNRNLYRSRQYRFLPTHSSLNLSKGLYLIECLSDFSSIFQSLCPSIRSYQQTKTELDNAQEGFPKIVRHSSGLAQSPPFEIKRMTANRDMVDKHDSRMLMLRLTAEFPTLFSIPCTLSRVHWRSIMPPLISCYPSISEYSSSHILLILCHEIFHFHYQVLLSTREYLNHDSSNDKWAVDVHPLSSEGIGS